MSFDYLVQSPEFIFHSAHFILTATEKEKLHGHSYRVEVNLSSDFSISSAQIAHVQQAISAICKELNYKFLLPAKSEEMSIVDFDGKHYQLVVRGDPQYVFPKSACVLLPIPSSSAEFIASFLGLELSKQNGLRATQVRVKIFEKEGQQAACQFRL
jgi:6-pyruvoyltetrahydropterin/6-carboxytetrahydropterin synthase